MIDLKMVKLDQPLLHEFRNELIHENSKRLVFILYLVIVSQLIFILFELVNILRIKSSITVPRVVAVIICSIFIITIYLFKRIKDSAAYTRALGILINVIQYVSLFIGCFFVIYMFNNESHSLSAFLFVAFIVLFTWIRSPYCTYPILILFVGLAIYLHALVEPISFWTGEFLISLLIMIILFMGTLLNYNRHANLFLKEREVLDINRTLRTMSQTDESTGIYNRRKMSDMINEHIDLFRRYQSSFSIAILDLDYFKNINDQYGHNTGDAILARFTKEVQPLLRVNDLFGRWGGDEFILLLPNSNDLESHALLERLRKHIEMTALVSSIYMTFSAGICSYRHNESHSELLDKADQALYTAKNSGKNQVAIFTTETSS